MEVGATNVCVDTGGHTPSPFLIRHTLEPTSLQAFASGAQKLRLKVQARDVMGERLMETRADLPPRFTSVLKGRDQETWYDAAEQWILSVFDQYANKASM